MCAVFSSGNNVTPLCFVLSLYHRQSGDNNLSVQLCVHLHSCGSSKAALGWIGDSRYSVARCNGVTHISTLAIYLAALTYRRRLDCWLHALFAGHDMQTCAAANALASVQCSAAVCCLLWRTVLQCMDCLWTMKLCTQLTALLRGSASKTQRPSDDLTLLQQHWRTQWHSSFCGSPLQMLDVNTLLCQAVQGD